MPHFRPLPIFTIVCTVMFAALIALGVWQLQRLHWKLGLIAEVNRSLTLPPVSLDKALAMGAAAQYHRVLLDGWFLNEKESYVYASGPGGAPVYHVLTPFETREGPVLMVDRGIVPTELVDPHKRARGQLDERVMIGVWHIPDAPGFFTPPPDTAHRIWYSRDVAAMAAAGHVKLAAPVVVEADAAPNPGGWPLGGQTQVAFRNEHLQYAITWFALAAALLGVYLAYHISRGRLGWR
ncbi:MAG: SURF1 family protein [Rhizomicrobium sp.]|jgi:surfeit locus 1 family protein